MIMILIVTILWYKDIDHGMLGNDQKTGWNDQNLIYGVLFCEFVNW